MVGGGPGLALPPHPAHLSGKQVGAPLPWLLMQSDSGLGMLREIPLPPLWSHMLHPELNSGFKPTCLPGGPNALPHAGLCNLRVWIVNKAV